MIGKRFGRLIVASRGENDKFQSRRWNCLCDCGGKSLVTTRNLNKGNSKSCGCATREAAKSRMTKHGLIIDGKLPEIYNTWALMVGRCFNLKNKQYKDYGGRGITVCDRWKDSFADFASDMGEKPFHKAQIDRINNDGNYEPNNCRWVDSKTNCRNKRSNHVVEFNGVSKCVSEWAEFLGMAYQTLRCRLFKYNWSVERALSTP